MRPSMVRSAVVWPGHHQDDAKAQHQQQQEDQDHQEHGRLLPPQAAILRLR